MPKPHYFAHVLRAERKRQKRSQRDVGKGADTTQATIARWENGDREPSLSSVVRWAYALGLAFVLVPPSKPLRHKGDFKMKLYNIDGVKRRHNDNTYRIPIGDLTIDDRPAYYRHYNGALDLAFEDGAEERVSMPVEDDLTEQERETLVANVLLPQLRAATPIAGIDSTTAVNMAKDFLAYLKTSSNYGIAESTGYGSMDPADETLVEWKIEEWARRFDA